jgi:hypothetical protein
MDSRKPRQGPSNLPRQTKTQLSLLPDDNGTRKKAARSARLPDGPEESQTVERAAFRERVALERFLKRMDYTANEWEKRRRHYLEEPLSDEELNSLTWKAAKLRHSGAAVEVALKRQKPLTPDLWMVAFLLAQGNGRRDIPHIIDLKQRRVDMLIAELRRIVYDEIHTDTDGAVIRWFLGL